MDLRPQAHEIIRTWLFSSVVRAHFEHDSLTWTKAAISGWVLDPDRKKMSKSKGNVVTPIGLLDQYGTDAVRYWSTSARPGVDTAFDENQMKVGRKLAIKILNVSKFVLGLGPAGDLSAVTEPLDRAVLGRLADLVDGATVDFEGYDYARVLERSEQFFWAFCDDHVELVKGRAYGSFGDDAAASARTSLRLALRTLLQLFAPFLPYVTEEVWSWWQEGSIHRSRWPESAQLRAAAQGAPAGTADAAAWVLGAIRKAKSEAKRSMRTQVTRAVVTAPADTIAALEIVRRDLMEAGVVAQLVTRSADGAEPSVAVELAPAEG